ncbi:unnamed protein product [Linum tenue]|uniref:Uncharacterized protein n=1 Tax=Linum tenue TaxID=586396 RepID=A0AAV0R5F7_9ROSI|nr:unnamed protein product [Linum tenue]
MFWIEKSNGKKHFALAADNPLYWTWKRPTQEHYPTGFREVVELRTICWLEIQAHFPTKFLSPYTTYAPYLVLQLADRAYGLDLLPAHVSVKVGNFDFEGEVLLRRRFEKDYIARVRRELDTHLYLTGRISSSSGYLPSTNSGASKGKMSIE